MWRGMFIFHSIFGSFKVGDLKFRNGPLLISCSNERAQMFFGIILHQRLSRFDPMQIVWVGDQRASKSGNIKGSLTKFVNKPRLAEFTHI
jgi:hypothetical protein